MRRSETKEVLASAFVKLAKTKNVDRITVQNIAQESGFSHPTFYNHFKDKYDLMNWIYETALTRYFLNLKPVGSWKELLEDRVETTVKNKDYLLNCYLHTTGQDSFLNSASRIEAKILKGYVEKMTGAELTTPMAESLEIFCHGALYYILEWLLGRNNLSEAQLIQTLEESLPQEIKRLVFPC